MFKFDNYTGHVVATKAFACVQVSRTILLEYHFSHCRKTFELTVSNSSLHSVLAALIFGSFGSKWFGFAWTSRQLLRNLEIRLSTVLKLFLCLLYKVASLLTSHTIPDTVTGTNYKLSLRSYLRFGHVSISTDRHLLWSQLDIFVLPVADSSAYSNNTVHTTFFNIVACCDNPWFLLRQVWLMVLRQIKRLTFLAQYGPSIPCICAVNVRIRD